MFQVSGEEIASIVVVAGIVVLYFIVAVACIVVPYFLTLKDHDRERRERTELKEEVPELAEQLVTEQLDKARREQVEMQETFLSARCLHVQPGSRAANRGLRSTRRHGEVAEEQGHGLLQERLGV
jgi:hypothetical protein